MISLEPTARLISRNMASGFYLRTERLSKTLLDAGRLLWEPFTGIANTVAGIIILMRHAETEVALHAKATIPLSG